MPARPAVPPVPAPQLKCRYCERECKSAGGRGKHEQSCKDKPSPAAAPATAEPTAGIVLPEIYAVQPGAVSISGYVPSDTEDNTSGDESKLYPLEEEVEVLEIEVEIEELQQAATTGARKRKQKNALVRLYS